MQEFINHPIQVAGLSITTSFEQAEQDIAELWRIFLTTNIKELLRNIISLDIYSVYSDYKSDYKGQYKVTLGLAVTNTDNLAAGLSSAIIPKGKYAIYQADANDPKNIIESWQKIWSIEQCILPRNYITDFQVHREDGVSIYVGHD